MKRKSKRKSVRPKTKLGLPDLEQAKSAVLGSLPSPASPREYRRAIDEFVAWYCSEPRLSFSKSVVTRFRMYLEERHLAPTTINDRLAAVRRLAYEAADSGLLSPVVPGLLLTPMPNHAGNDTHPVRSCLLLTVVVNSVLGYFCALKRIPYLGRTKWKESTNTSTLMNTNTTIPMPTNISMGKRRMRTNIRIRTAMSMAISMCTNTLTLGMQALMSTSTPGNMAPTSISTPDITRKCTTTPIKQ